MEDFIQFVTLFSGAFFLYRFLSFLDRYGKDMLILDLIELLVILQWVFIPALYYCLRDYNLIYWRWYYWPMRVPASEYFELAIPSSIATLLGLRLYSGKIKMDFINLQQTLRRPNNGKVGIVLITISVVTGLLDSVIPESLKYVSTLFSNFFFIGLIYIYYSEIKYRTAILMLCVGYVVVKGLSGGMFGTIIWWPLFIFMIVLMGKNINFNVKLAVTVLGILLFSVLQSVKSTYRSITWLGRGNVEQGSSKIDVLNSLVQKKLKNGGSNIVSLESMYPLITRLNQGLHITNAMVYTPSQEPFANGETVVTAIAATIVPRVLWPDKPEAGGKVNYKRFTGYTLKNASMNIGQIGDAYVNFTTVGAPIFLFFYGLLLSAFYGSCMKLVSKYPRLLLWLPFLFTSLITVESDLLTTINALFKSALFLFILFKVNKNIFT